MSKINKTALYIVLGAGVISLCSCTNNMHDNEKIIPSIVYSQKIREQQERGALGQNHRTLSQPAQVSLAASQDPRARVRFVSDEMPEDRNFQPPAFKAPEDNQDFVENDDGYTKVESKHGNTRDYTGPLALGDPGVSASLWRESRGGNDIFRDDRAWQPMDLVTIVVTEKSEGNNEANTEVKEKSSILASIENILGFENDIKAANTLKGATASNVDLTSLVKADTQNDFKGEGKTNRKDSLTAKISAMVVEVLPSGIMRIEGQKIIAVNSEEKIMVISGLIRAKDVNSANEVDSSRIANVRIDYFGKGIVGEAQNGGWFSRLMRVVWPF